MFGQCHVGRSTRLLFQYALLAAMVAALASCRREDREFATAPPASSDKGVVALSTIAPGPAAPETRRSITGQKVSQNAFQIAQGKRLFSWYNCTGCHGHGGGGSGPALMDDSWIYGGAVENIAATIREGRPNGMPSFGGLIPEDQVWQLAAYVRAMSGNASKAARPSRDDDLYPGEPEQMREPEPARMSNLPPAAEQPQ